MDTGRMAHRCTALTGVCGQRFRSAFSPKQPLPHFLLVANNPAIAAAQWHWLSAAWTVVRFNDCKVDWPPATDAVTEVLFLRSLDGDYLYHGKTADGGLACEQRLQRDFAGHVLHIGGRLSDLPLTHFPNYKHAVSSGTTVAMALMSLFPTAPIVCAGFTFHQGHGVFDAYQGHPFTAEKQLLTASRRVYVLPTVQSIDQFDFEHVARIMCPPEQPDCSSLPPGAPPPGSPPPGAPPPGLPPPGAPPTGQATNNATSLRASPTPPPAASHFVSLGAVLLEVLLVMVALRLTFRAFRWELRCTRAPTQTRWSSLPSIEEESEQVEPRASLDDLGVASDKAVLEAFAAPMSIELTQTCTVELPGSCGVTPWTPNTCTMNATHIVAATAALAPCTSQTDNAAELQQRLAEGSCAIDDGAEWQRRLDEESCVIDDVVEWQQRLDAGGSGDVLHDPSLDAEESYIL